MYIEPEQTDEESMKITINQAEIEAAITAYIMSQVSIKEGQKINIELKATRGAEGYSAEIDITAEQIGGTGNISVASAIAAAREEPVTITTSTVQAAAAAQQATAEAASEVEPVVIPTPTSESIPTASDTAQIDEQRPSLFGGLNQGG